jgi:hypothetical protein
MPQAGLRLPLAAREKLHALLRRSSWSRHITSDTIARGPRSTHVVSRDRLRRVTMQLNSIVNAQETHLTKIRAWLSRRAIPIALAAGVAVALEITMPHRVAAQDGQGQGRVCSNATLRGDYGRLSSGIRPAPANPAVTESFVATALRTYDGNGGSPRSAARMDRSLPPFGTLRGMGRTTSEPIAREPR